MTDTWKAAVRDYVYGLNRMEAERSFHHMQSIVADDSYLRRRGTIFDRLTDSRPVRSETRALPIHINEHDRVAKVRLRLHKRWTHEGRVDEERIEHETLTLAMRKEGWVVAKVDIEVPEREQPDFDQNVDASTPYLNRSVIDNRPGAARPARYNRQAAMEYAETWWNSANPKYHLFEVDCTSFVSQCLFAGGLPMNYTGKRSTGWWYKGYSGGSEGWSYSWAVAHSLQTYLLSTHYGGIRGSLVADPRELAIGDIISYDWDGNARFTHSTIVTAHDPFGFPLVNAHTNNSRMRFWEYRDSYAWTERTRYGFIHLSD